MSIVSPTTLRLIVVATLGFTASAASAVTQLPQYPTHGRENPVEYSFSAARTGSVTAHYTGSTASYSESLGLMVNGIKTGISGLNNKTSTMGEKLALGTAKAGHKLTFFIDVLTTRKIYYSERPLDADGVNHVFAAAHTGTGLVPAGTYVGFEDLWTDGDLDYFDLRFLFRNVAAKKPAVVAIPEPTSWVMLIAGFGFTGAMLRRRRLMLAA
jgi:hypothetical protein